MRQLTPIRVIGKYRVRLEWKPQDLWRGAYWHTTVNEWSDRVRTDLWICLVPMLPIHISWFHDDVPF